MSASAPPRLATGVALGGTAIGAGALDEVAAGGIGDVVGADGGTLLSGRPWLTDGDVEPDGGGLLGGELTGSELTGSELTGAESLGTELVGGELLGTKLVGGELLNTSMPQANQWLIVGTLPSSAPTRGACRSVHGAVAGSPSSPGTYLL